MPPARPAGAGPSCYALTAFHVFLLHSVSRTANVLTGPEGRSDRSFGEVRTVVRFLGPHLLEACTDLLASLAFRPVGAAEPAGPTPS